MLVILDGASEPLRDRTASALERADTPTLDALAATGTLTRVRTVPVGLTPGSEVAIPVLLGWTPPDTVDRGAVEAAAHGIAVAPGEHAWRVDVRCSVGGRAGAVATARAAGALRRGAPRHTVHGIGGHRLLLVGPAPRPDVTGARGLRVWPEGVDLPGGILDGRDVVVAARGACAGIARLLGATVVHPDGATGDVDTGLGGKARAAVAAIHGGARTVVVHVAGADEAAHRGDADAKVAFLERVDRELLPVLADAVRAAGGTLRIQPDHGCDPRTGAHDGHPVPCLTWPADAPPSGAPNIDPAGPGAGTIDVRPLVDTPGPRLTERAAAGLPVTDLTTTSVPA